MSCWSFFLILCRNVSMSMTTQSHWKVKQSVRLIVTGENTPWPGLNIIQERYVNILVQFSLRGPYIVFCFFSIFSPPSTLEKDNVYWPQRLALVLVGSVPLFWSKVFVVEIIFCVFDFFNIGQTKFIFQRGFPFLPFEDWFPFLFAS